MYFPENFPAYVRTLRTLYVYATACLAGCWYVHVDRGVVLKHFGHLKRRFTLDSM